jgi:hypothetical protein
MGKQIDGEEDNHRYRNREYPLHRGPEGSPAQWVNKLHAVLLFVTACLTFSVYLPGDLKARQGTTRNRRFHSNRSNGTRIDAATMTSIRIESKHVH